MRETLGTYQGFHSNSNSYSNGTASYYMCTYIISVSYVFIKKKTKKKSKFLLKKRRRRRGRKKKFLWFFLGDAPSVTEGRSVRGEMQLLYFIVLC